MRQRKLIRTRVKKAEQKQNADKSTDNPGQDGFNAKELGEQSSYEDTTEFAQRMRRGKENRETGDDLDIVGTVDFWETEQGREEKHTRIKNIKSKPKKQENS